MGKVLSISAYQEQIIGDGRNLNITYNSTKINEIPIKKLNVVCARLIYRYL